MQIKNLESRLEKFITTNKHSLVKTPATTTELMEYVNSTENPAETVLAVSMALNLIGHQLGCIIAGYNRDRDGVA